MRANSGINSVADLRGKTAAMGGFGACASTRTRCPKPWTDPKTDVRIVFVPFHLTLSLLINRQIDVGAIDPVQQIIAERQYPGQLKTLFTYEDVTQGAIGNMDTNGLLLVAGMCSWSAIAKPR